MMNLFLTPKLSIPLKYVLWGTGLLLSIISHAQEVSNPTTKPQISMSGFLDVYYVYDFNNPQTDYRQQFLYNHNRHNEFNLNLGLLKATIEHSRYRANLAFQAGTYVQDNYANEPALLKNIFEASIGISLARKNPLWLEAGIFASHLGFESAVSIDNWTLTRSLLAENSPYYLSGVKLIYQPNTKTEITVLLCNGWQHIQKVKGNSLPALGTQLKLSPNENVTFNWSTFLGTDDPDTSRRIRYFQNLYGQFRVSKRFALITGFDIGLQQRNKGSTQYNTWFSPVVIGQYLINTSWKTAIRAEYYQDKSGVIIPVNSDNGFRVFGLSSNLDYAPAQNILCRLEGRWLTSRDKLFPAPTTFTSQNLMLGISMAMKFAASASK